MDIRYLPWEYLLMPIIFIGILIAGKHKGKKQKELLERQTLKRNAKLESRFFSFYPSLNINEEDTEIKVYLTAGNEESSKKTIMKGKLELFSSRNLSINIVRNNFTGKMTFIIGLKKAITNDMIFDKDFIVRTNDELVILDYLTPGLKEAMLKIKDSQPIFQFTKKNFIFSIDRHLNSDAEYDEFIETGLLLMRKLREIC